jgi:hypothetical protein
MTHIDCTHGSKTQINNHLISPVIYFPTWPMEHGTPNEYSLRQKKIMILGVGYGS